MAEPEEYSGRRVTVFNDGKRCIHSRYCVLGLNSVFVPNVDGPWIKPDAADHETVMAVVERCPSGALRYAPVEGVEPEQPPTVNTVRVWENGPLAFHGALDIAGDKSCYRATLCRCGRSKRKPFCDKSHVEAKFAATGEPESLDSAALAVRNGPLKITPQHDGPLMVEGALEVCAGSGRTISRETKVWLCRCGHSLEKPFCDGSHKMAGFRDAGKLPVD
jgi:CDGSH-type Zn-finger protein/uncharacterized Fe-S cluster protein YjdI